jgi:outer membrane protein assembly factor BamB
LLDAGEVQAAARLLQDMVWLHADAVVQVQAGEGRWAGAGELALQQLLTRVPRAVREELCAPSDRHALEEAIAWRDAARLRALSGRLEGLPEGAQAAAAAARLLAEGGAREAALAAADRARLVADDAELSALAARLAPPAVAEAPPPELPATLRPQWSVPLLVAGLGRRNPFFQRGSDNEAPIAPVVPLLAEGVAYVADSLSVDAFDLLSGRRLWHHAGPLEAVETLRAWDRWFRFSDYLDDWRTRAVSPWQVAQPTLAQGRLLAVEQVAEARRELNEFEGIPINHPLPERRLLCLDAASGAELWRQQRPERGADDFVNRFSVAGAPVVADGAVYVAGYILEGALNAYLAAFDLADGSLLWRTYLCSGQQDLTMFNRPFLEHTPSPPLLHDGALYVCTNLGIAACVDAFSGRVRWLAGYEFIPRRAGRSPDRDPHRDVRWVNRAPQLAGGRLLVMPLDGEDLLALDPASGRLGWKLDTLRPDHRGLRFDALALPDGRLMVASDTLLEAVDSATGRVQWGALLPDDEEASGPLALAGSRVLLPATRGLVVLDAEAADHKAARIEWDATLRLGTDPRHVPLRRRVVAGPRCMLLTDGWELHAIVDVEALLASALSRAEEGPEGRLAAGELLLAGGQLQQAATQLDTALALASLPAALRERLAGARLRVALAVAQDSGARADWLAQLACGERLGQPFAHAEAALDALAALGTHDDEGAALARLAALEPERRLTLAAAGDAPLPVGLLAALVEPSGESPEAAVARLQGLIEDWPDERWDGVSVREWAAARIAALLVEHGRGSYARWDARATAALEQADDAASLQAVEARYPNALVVEEARRRRLASWLADGRALDVLADLCTPPPSGYGAEIAALRAQAATALGETALADALTGVPAPPFEAPLPALPAAGAQLTRPELPTRGKIVFPPLSGRLGAPYASCVLGCVKYVGELFVLDCASAQVLWRRPLPVGLTSAAAGYVEFYAAGDRLLLLTYAGAGSPADRLQAQALSDGLLLWSMPLEGKTRSAVLADGLLLRLAMFEPGDGTRHYRLSGYGTVSGSRALELDLPACEDAYLLLAGGWPVLFTVGGLTREGAFEDGRLWSIDPAAGRLLGGELLPGEAAHLVLPGEDPGAVLLTARDPADGALRLLAWDARERRVTWNVPAPATLLSRQTLYPAGDGRLLLHLPARPQDGRPALQLLPIDVRLGPLPTTTVGVPLSIMNGQSAGRVPRLVFSRDDDLSRLFVADARTAERLFELSLPAPLSGYARVLHGRDGFVLACDSGGSGGSVTLRVIDGGSGAERYSGALEVPRAQSRVELALAEGAVVMAWGGVVHVVGNSPVAQPVAPPQPPPQDPEARPPGFSPR